MNVFKNFRKAKSGHIEEFAAIEIRYNDTEVFADLPVCIVPYAKELKEPMLFKTTAGIGMAMEKEELLKTIATQRIFYLKKDDKGVVKEVVPEEAQIRVRLPKDTVVKDLDIMGNQVFKIEKQPQQQKELKDHKQKNK